MHVAISHHSAFKFLDMCARNQPLPEYRFILKSYDGPNPDQLAHSRRELTGFSLDRFVNDNGLIDIFVPNHSLLRTLKGFRHHAFGGELPEGSFIDAGHGFSYAARLCSLSSFAGGKQYSAASESAVTCAGSTRLSQQAKAGLSSENSSPQQRNLKSS